MLVNLAEFDQRLTFDIRYATDDNFLGFAVYSKPVCYLHPDAAKAVRLIQSDLEEIGLSLKVYDGYRPLSIQQVMWDKIQDERFISNPSKNKGRHTRGTAIDVTLIDLKGNELEMPTPFDDFSEKAFSDAVNISDKAKENRSLLKDTMEKHGFTQFPYEWWHFDFVGWENDEKYPALDISLDLL